jgi:hypothetical protein
VSQNPTPLQRRLVHLDLKKGLDERGRPEIMDAAVSLTRVENVIVEQDGSWVKRPGLQYLGDSLNDDLGFPLGSATRPIRTIGGLGALVLKETTGIHLTNETSLNLYRYAENRQRMRDSGQVSEMSVTGNLIASSQAMLTTGTSGPRIMAVAGSSIYDAVIYESGGELSGGATTSPQLLLVIYERDSQSEAARYAMPAGMVSSAPKLCFVNDRYLHVYYRDTGTGGVRVIALDTTANGLPSQANLGTGTLIVALSTIIVDVAVSDTHSLVLCTNGTLYKVDTSGALTSSVTLANWSAGNLGSMAMNWSTGAILVLYIDQATSRLRVASVASSTMVATALFLDPTLTAATIGADAFAISVSDTGGIMLVGEQDFTFSTGTTAPVIRTYYTANSSSTSFSTGARINCWRHASTPFYCRYTNKHYMHVVKYDSVDTSTATHAIVCLSDFETVSTQYTGGIGTHSTVRAAAMLEQANGYQLRTAPSVYASDLPNVPLMYRLLRRGSDATESANAEYPAALAYRQAASSMAVAFYTLKFCDQKCGNSAGHNSANYVSCGLLSKYDGYMCSEQGFVDQPFATALDSGGGTGPNGSYNYAFVFRSVDSVGGVSYSRVYGPVSITVADNTVTLAVSPAHVTAKETGVAGDQQVSVEVYRTLTGGTVYYYVGDARRDATADGLFRLSDSTTDANLALNRMMFRQPGTTNTPLDRYPGPGGAGIICQHKDRVFVADPYGQRVWYSSFAVDGESAWFSPGFTFFVNGGSGPITGMASLDGRLVVFKKDSVFVVDGDGPPEGGGNGSEFTPPTRLAIEYGCVDHRSIVSSPIGLFYRSTMGIELLSRSLERSWIGELVQNTVDDNQVTLGSCLDSLGIVHFLLSTAEGLGSGVACTELLYDLAAKTWSKTPHNIRDLTGICTFEDGGAEKVCYTAVAGGLGGSALVASSTTSVDVNLGRGQTTTYPSMCLESAWIHISGPQGRQRVHDFFFLARKDAGANHALKVSVAYNYVESYTQTYTWEPGTINSLGIEQLNLNPNKQDVIAIRFKVEDQAPANTVTYPVGTAAGCDVLSMAIDVAPKTGGSKLAVDAKG